MWIVPNKTSSANLKIGCLQNVPVGSGNPIKMVMQHCPFGEFLMPPFNSSRLKKAPTDNHILNWTEVGTNQRHFRRTQSKKKLISLFLNISLVQIGNNQCRMEWREVKLASLDRPFLNGTRRMEYFLFQGFMELLDDNFAAEIRCKHATVEQLREWMVDVGGRVPEDFALGNAGQEHPPTGFYVPISSEQAAAGVMAAVFLCNHGTYVRGQAQQGVRFDDACA